MRKVEVLVLTCAFYLWAVTFGDVPSVDHWWDAELDAASVVYRDC